MSLNKTRKRTETDFNMLINSSRAVRAVQALGRGEFALLRREVVHNDEEIVLEESYLEMGFSITNIELVPGVVMT